MISIENAAFRSLRTGMDIVSFDAIRSLNLPNIHYIKPDAMYGTLARIRAADGVIFPQYWQINPLVYGLKQRIFPSVASYMIGHDKIEMSRCFEIVAPDHVPQTLILANSESNADYIWQTLTTPFVAKIPRSSMGNGVFLIESHGDWRTYVARSEILYAQEYLPIDRDLRILWVGEEIIGGYWRTQSPMGFYNNVAKGGVIEQGLVPLEARMLVEHIALSLGIDHGGFDIAMVGSKPYVFEFNRLFGNRGFEGGQKRIDDHILAYLRRIWSDQPPLQPRQPLAPPA